MIITRTSQLTGITRSLDLPITDDQYMRLQGNELIQKVLPHLTADQREFYLTGITAEEWDNAFPEE